MRHWTQVRSISDLKTFQTDFRELIDEQKQEIITEMVMQLAIYKEKDSQTDLFREGGRQVAGLILEERSTRRKPRRLRR